MRLLPVLLLLACAGGAPTQYAQGIPTPRPPVFNPVTDSPITVGQPGRTRAQPLPRSPHQRQLPPPGDWPGVWGADPPKAGLSRESDRDLWGYRAAVPEDATPAEKERANDCARALRRSAYDGGLEDAVISALNTDAKHCMVARLYETCLSRGERRAEKMGRPEEIREWWRRLREEASAAARLACVQRIPTPESARIEAVLRRGLDAAFDLIVTSR